MSLPIFYEPTGYHPHGQSKGLVAAMSAKYGDAVEVKRHTGLSNQGLSVGHSGKYVRQVASIDIASAAAVAAGGVLAAAEYVYNHDYDKNGGHPIACAPYTGFSQAHWERGESRCTFNGLAITALTMVKNNTIETALILDCNLKPAEGTQDILDSMPDDDTGFVQHWSAGNFYNEKHEAELFLRELPDKLLPYKYVDLVLYQAGADQYVGDPHGGFLTMRQLRLRDHIIFNVLGDWGVPIVWTTGNGFSSEKEVEDIHEITVQESLFAFMP